MKKITVLFAFLLANGLNAQDSVTLDMQLLPNKKYEIVSNYDMKMEMAMGGDSTAIDMIMSGKGNMMTQNISAGKIPVTMKVVMDMNMTMEGMPPEAKKFNIEALGNVKKGEFVPVFDSINALDEFNKKDAFELLNKIMEQISLPKKTLKTGESFIEEMPIELPSGNGELKMIDKVTYKLLKIEEEKAYFTISHDMDFNSSTEDREIKGSGRGTGEMVYDIVNKYPVINNGNLDIEMSMQQGGMEIQMKMNTKTTQTNTISNK